MQEGEFQVINNAYVHELKVAKKPAENSLYKIAVCLVDCKGEPFGA